MNIFKLFKVMTCFEDGHRWRIWRITMRHFKQSGNACIQVWKRCERCGKEVDQESVSIEISEHDFRRVANLLNAEVID
jgi:hypothetical protein